MKCSLFGKRHILVELGGHLRVENSGEGSSWGVAV